MTRSVWSLLGIEAGSDRAAIRRAYAAKLRQTHPEDNPEGFKALRAAYEQALAMADARAWQEQIEAEEALEEETPAEAVYTPTLTPDEATAVLTGQVGAPQPQPQEDFLQGRDQDLAEFERRMNALSGLLNSPWPQEDAVLEDAFRAVLASPAMEEIGVRAHAEQWLAHTLASTVPKSDAILLQAIEAFGWDGAAGQRGQSHAVAAILHRIDEWRAIEALTSQGDEYHHAFQELSRPPRRTWEMRLRTFNPGVARRVQRLIDYSRWQMPGLRHSFHADTLAWWEEYFAQPRMTLGRLMIAPAAFAVVLALIALFDPAGPLRKGLLVAGGIVALVLPLAHLKTIGGIAHGRESGEGPYLPQWAETGWIAPLYLLPLAAMIAPPSPIWAVAAILIAVLGMQWTQLMGGVRYRATSENPLAWILTIGFYGIFSFAPFVEASASAQIVVGATAALLIHARLTAVDRLMAIGEPLTQRFKAPGLAAIALLAALAWASPLAPPFLAAAPAALAALLANAMFHGGDNQLRYWVRLMIGFAFLVAAVQSIPERPRVISVSPASEAGSASVSPKAGAADVPIADRETPVRGLPFVPLQPSADQLEEALLRHDPELAQLRQGNPELFARIRGVLEQQAEGGYTPRAARQAIDGIINGEYARMRDDAPDALLAEGMRLQLEKRLALGRRSAPACAEPAVPPVDALYPDSLIKRQNALIYATLSSPPQRSRTGKPILANTVEARASEALGVTRAELAERMVGKGRDIDVCRARIETLRALLAESPRR